MSLVPNRAPILPAREHDPSAGSNSLNRPRRSPGREAAVPSSSLRRSSSPGFPKGPQPLGTLTLPARSSVLYLRARDRHTHPAALRFSLLPRREGIPCPAPVVTPRTPHPLLSDSHIAFPFSVSNQFHNAWHLQSFGSHFRMTANAFSLPFGLQETHRYTLYNTKL